MYEPCLQRFHLRGCLEFWIRNLRISKTITKALQCVFLYDKETENVSLRGSSLFKYLVVKAEIQLSLESRLLLPQLLVKKLELNQIKPIKRTMFKY